jgi:hypothetical protein
LSTSSGVAWICPARARALGHAREDLLLLLGEALHRRHQVGHQVGAALVLVDHLRPRGLDLLVAALQVVVAAALKQQRQQRRREPPGSLHSP